MSERRPDAPPSDRPDGLARSVRRRRDRQREWETTGEPSVMAFVGQIGVLGWQIVVPALIGLFVGRWLDRTLASGIFWTAALLFCGVSLGFWSAWRWMHAQR